MNAGTRKVLILAVLGLMLVSTSSAILSPSSPGRAIPHSAAPHAAAPNQYFQDILLGQSANSTEETTFFSPFSYNVSNFTVTGKFVTFRLFTGTQSNPYVGLYDLLINEAPFANVSEVVYREFGILNPDNQLFHFNTLGSIFYGYSSSALFIVHDDPEGLVQVYTYNANATVVALLSDSFQLTSKVTIWPGSPQSPLSNGTVAVMYNDTQISGYFVSAGTNFTLQQTTGDAYFVTKTVAPNSFLNTFAVPNGDSPIASVLSTVAQGMGNGAISYYAALSLKGGVQSVDGAYYNNVLRVSQISLSRGDIRMKISPVLPGVSSTIVLLVSDSIINGSASNVIVEVDGKVVSSTGSLPSFITPFGNVTKDNVTEAGQTTVVTVYSPSEINTLQVFVVPPKTGNLVLTVIAPFVGALIVITAASFTLIRRKSRGMD